MPPCRPPFPPIASHACPCPIPSHVPYCPMSSSIAICRPRFILSLALDFRPGPASPAAALVAPPCLLVLAALTAAPSPIRVDGCHAECSACVVDDLSHSSTSCAGSTHLVCHRPHVAWVGRTPLSVRELSGFFLGRRTEEEGLAGPEGELPAYHAW
ncbi:hypothetical protein B0T26DRAFT_242775 [Lasiosphaeria miniovina]|uniref:Uncharacterized protein n=1 Tax=Lasiosphaeria miniovina TaxID=1954250 RepID=A0AA40AVT3_9PEZI|nr:uncharacterized protein B0T26DRAFT_242775 [Lasiosphaeria miniovina]KAK0722957.1 hypothetical protein B0T26DRAFT_242775 [Lasiosphaeria miniovina]